MTGDVSMRKEETCSSPDGESEGGAESDEGMRRGGEG